MSRIELNSLEEQRYTVEYILHQKGIELPGYEDIKERLDLFYQTC